MCQQSSLATYLHSRRSIFHWIFTRPRQVLLQHWLACSMSHVGRNAAGCCGTSEPINTRAWGVTSADWSFRTGHNALQHALTCALLVLDLNWAFSHHIRYITYIDKSWICGCILRTPRIAWLFGSWATSPILHVQSLSSQQQDFCKKQPDDWISSRAWTGRICRMSQLWHKVWQLFKAWRISMSWILPILGMQRWVLFSQSSGQWGVCIKCRDLRSLRNWHQSLSRGKHRQNLHFAYFFLSS